MSWAQWQKEKSYRRRRRRMGASSHQFVLSRSYPRNLVPGGPSWRMRLTKLSPSLSGGGAVGRWSLLSTSKAAVKERTEVSFRYRVHRTPASQGEVWFHTVFGSAPSIGHKEQGSRNWDPACTMEVLLCQGSTWLSSLFPLRFTARALAKRKKWRGKISLLEGQNCWEYNKNSVQQPAVFKDIPQQPWGLSKSLQLPEQGAARL